MTPALDEVPPPRKSSPTMVTTPSTAGSCMIRASPFRPASLVRFSEAPGGRLNIAMRNPLSSSGRNPEGVAAKR